MRCTWLIPLLAGCSGGGSAAWIEAAGYAWNGFNHRVSFIHFAVDDQGAEVAVVGGASTTGTSPDLPAGCDDATCGEYPVLDSSVTQLAWARVTDKKLVFGSGHASLLADAAGAQTSIEVPLDGRGKGDALALIQGFTIDSDHALSGGEGCYDPALGWHVRRMALSLDDAQLSADGESVQLDVSAAFEAGVSLEEARQCQDEVVDQAQVPITIHVLAVAGKRDMELLEVSHGAEYAFSGDAADPGEQPDPDLDQRPLDSSIEDPMAGWAALDYRFHQDDADQRGAYLRTFSFGLDVTEGWASGHATNYSPYTQLSGFSYDFEGRVALVDASRATVERGLLELELDAELEDDGSPEIEREDW